MVSGHVELVLFEQSIANPDGIQRPFSDRVADAAEKTAGSVLFDVRVDDDAHIRRIAAIGYGPDGVVVIVMDRNGEITSAPTDRNADLLVAELTAWFALPMAGQISVSYIDATTKLLAELRKAGRFDRAF